MCFGSLCRNAFVALKGFLCSLLSWLLLLAEAALSAFSVVIELWSCGRELGLHVPGRDGEYFRQCAARGHVFLHGLILWVGIFSLQAKEAGAGDTLDISKCELSEVGSLQLPVLAPTHTVLEADSSVCFLLPTVRFSIMAVSLEAEMGPLLPVSAELWLSSGGFFPPFVGRNCLSYLMLPQDFCPGVPFSFDRMGRTGWCHTLHQYLGKTLVQDLMA